MSTIILQGLNSTKLVTQGYAFSEVVTRSWQGMDLPPRHVGRDIGPRHTGMDLPPRHTGRAVS